MTTIRQRHVQTDRQTDRRTDRQTTYHGNTALCVASRGKNPLTRGRVRAGPSFQLGTLSTRNSKPPLYDASKCGNVNDSGER